MMIVVKAKDLIPGDVLCIDPATEIEWGASWNSMRVHTSAYLILWQSMADQGRLASYRLFQEHLNDCSRRIEHASSGLFRARVVLGDGVVVRIPKNTGLAVYRKEFR